jgi:DNA-binding IclR family transcriptional regulator
VPHLPPASRAQFYMMVVDLVRMAPVDLRLTLGEALLLALVAAGTIEGRPWSPSKAAVYLQIPRPTIDRWAQTLEERGFITRQKQGKSVFLRMDHTIMAEANPEFARMFNKAHDRTRLFFLAEDWA